MAYRYDSYFQYFKFLILAHLLNPFWKGRVERRSRRNYYNYRRVAHYLKRRYLPFVKAIDPQKEPYKSLHEGFQEEEYIYSIWFQGEENAPELVKICFERLRKVYGDRFRVLSEKTLWNFIDLPDHIKKKREEGKITNAHFSDICRVALLYQHGGIWFDATDFITSPVPEWIWETDMFMFRDGERFTPQKFIQSCFLRGKKGNPFFKAQLDFLSEYWKHEDRLIDYFLFHFLLRFLVENNPKLNKIFYEMPQVVQTPTHILWHIHHADPYSEELYRESIKNTFFQKTTFKFDNAKNPKEGSVAYYIINRKIKDPDPFL